MKDLIAHKQEGTSDKVYIVGIQPVKTSSGIEYRVIGKWGRRGAVKFKEQVKGQYGDELAAGPAAHNVFREKIIEGYVDIDSIQYNGPVTRQSVTQHRIGDLVISVSKSRVATPSAPKYVFHDPNATYLATCKDNIGMEDSFDLDVEYLVKEFNNDGLLLVFNKFGSAIRVLPERFAVKMETAS